MIIDHRDLAVWKKAHRLTLRVYAVTKHFPAEERYGLIVQLRRAALSIATNLAEGAARTSRREFMQFTAIARGSASEVAHLLLVSHDLGFLPHEDFHALEDECNHIARMLTSMLRSLQRKSASTAT
ncbi:MAG TPA: four helix bundle protein [bacterium]|nr:four helix bundle protein [bacterium]